jgi:hypothetical protein
MQSSDSAVLMRPRKPMTKIFNFIYVFSVFHCRSRITFHVGSRGLIETAETDSVSQLVCKPKTASVIVLISRLEMHQNLARLSILSIKVFSLGLKAVRKIWSSSKSKQKLSGWSRSRSEFFLRNINRIPNPCNATRLRLRVYPLFSAYKGSNKLYKIFFKFV